MSVIIAPETVSDDFLQKIKELSGENVHLCMQCGTCAGSCPMTDHMDFSVRKVMHVAQLGMEKMLDKLNTHWVCASCHTCSVRCPRGIDIAKLWRPCGKLRFEKILTLLNRPKCPRRRSRDVPR